MQSQFVVAAGSEAGGLNCRAQMRMNCTVRAATVADLLARTGRAGGAAMRAPTTTVPRSSAAALVVLLFLRLRASFHRRARPPRPCRIEQSLAGARENDHCKDVQQQERDPPAPNLHTLSDISFLNVVINLLSLAFECKRARKSPGVTLGANVVGVRVRRQP